MDCASPARLAAIAGTAAALTVAGLGTAMLMRPEESVTSAGPSARHLNEQPPPVSVPLSDAEIVGLLTGPPDFGALADPRRRASCLSGLGYPPDDVLGGRQVEIAEAAAVVLLLPGDTPDTIAALAVRPNCSSADTELLADTQIRRPQR